MENILLVVPEYRVEEFKSEMKTLGARCARYGLACPTWTLIEERTIKVRTDERGNLIAPYEIIVYHFRVSGIVPHLNGYRFVAMLESMPRTTKNIVYPLPGATVPEEYFNSGARCEHCGLNRYRKISYVVQDASGQYKQVGSTCVHDYVGTKNLSGLLSHLENIFRFFKINDEDDYSVTPPANRIYALLDILSVACASVRAYGWRSSSAERELGGMSTADCVRRYVEEGPHTDKEKVQEVDRVQAAKILDAVTHALQTKQNLTDYERNLATIIDSQRTTYKAIGYSASIVPYGCRLEQQAHAQAASDASNWVGQVGQRMTGLHVTVTGKNSFETQYGTTHIYNFREGNNLLVWFASKSQDLEVGQNYTLAATIKKHDTSAYHGGAKITAINRCKIKDN